MPALPSRRAPRHGLRATLASAIAVAALVGAPVALAAPASAHDELVSTVPAEGVSLAEAPPAITLTFSDDVVELGTAVVVTDAAGARLADGAAVVDGAVVTRPITPPTVAGEVRVSYRVVSADGHPVTGTFAFTVSSASSPSASESQSAEPTEPGTTEPSESTVAGSPTESGTAAAAGSTTPLSSGSTGGSALPWVLGSLVAVGVVGAAVAASRRSKAGSRS